MRQSRLLSFFISILLHAGIIVAALFWPAGRTPPVDLNAPVIDIGIYTIGSPGKAPQQAASAPKAPSRPEPPASRPAPARPDSPQAPMPPKEPETPKEPERPKPHPEPDTPAIPIPRPEAPKEPEKPREPEKPKEPEKLKPGPDKPKEPDQPKTPARPKSSPNDVLRGALGDLSKGRSSSAVADALGELQRSGGGDDAEGDGPGGSGGDGAGVLGSYMQSLVSRIKPNWEYSGRADRKNPTAVVEITIAGDGVITGATIVTSSGDAAFDGSVLKAVFDTIRVERPPSAAFSKVRVPFAYEAIRR